MVIVCLSVCLSLCWLIGLSVGLYVGPSVLCAAGCLSVFGGRQRMHEIQQEADFLDLSRSNSPAPSPTAGGGGGAGRTPFSLPSPLARGGRLANTPPFPSSSDAPTSRPPGPEEEHLLEPLAYEPAQPLVIQQVGGEQGVGRQAAAVGSPTTTMTRAPGLLGSLPSSPPCLPALLL